MDNSQRRSGPRSKIHLPIRIKITPDAEATRTEIRDISARGIALYSDVDLSELPAIEIIVSVPYEISLEDAIDVRISAEVLRVEDRRDAASHFTTALQFTGLPGPEDDPSRMN